MKFFLLSIITFFSIEAFSKIEQLGVFAGHITKINNKAALVRVKVKFENMKYLNKRDRIEMFTEYNPEVRCKGYVAAKTHNYLLVKIPEIKICKSHVHLSVGAYTHFYSDDMVSNLKVGKDLLKLLHRKRSAIFGLMHESRTALHQHIEKVGAVNRRYQVIQEKLRKEWRDEITLLEEDRVSAFKQFEEYQRDLKEIDHKLEQYTIIPENFTTDRWSLDSRLYFKK